jgi:hypothetical protein
MRLCPGRIRHGVAAGTCLLLTLLNPLARAAELAELEVSEGEGIYRISLAMQVQAPAHYVRRVLTDYARIYRLNPAITESEILPSSDDGVVRVRTRIRDCIAFFCKEIDVVEDVRESGPDGLQVTTVPALSSFKSGSAEWQIHGMGDRSQVIYQAEMEPDFYIPPLIGSFVIKQRLRETMLTSLARIECIARIQAGLEQTPAPDPARMADAVTYPHAVGAALLAGEDPSVAARAPAAGSRIRESAGCARPCAVNDPSCQR